MIDPIDSNYMLAHATAHLSNKIDQLIGYVALGKAKYTFEPTAERDHLPKLKVEATESKSNMDALARHKQQSRLRYG